MRVLVCLKDEHCVLRGDPGSISRDPPPGPFLFRNQPADVKNLETSGKLKEFADDQPGQSQRDNQALPEVVMRLSPARPNTRLHIADN